MSEPVSDLRRRAALEAVRSSLLGLLGVGLLGIVGAFVSYRADVAEAQRQAHERIERQGRLYADSLALHFELLTAELQRLADQPLERLKAPDAELTAIIRDDENLFQGGVTVFALDGARLWSSKPDAKAPAAVQTTPWFQHVMSSGKGAVDGYPMEDGTRLVVALPVVVDDRLVAVVVGTSMPSESLLYGLDGPGESVVLLSSGRLVVLPLRAPAWASAQGLDGKLSALLTASREADWVIDGADVVAKAFSVRHTSLNVIAVESEALTIAPIQRRLKLQLAFLLLLQLVALGAFSLFLRGTYRAFAEVEARIAKQETMAALGSAASLIAHEVKNSLNGLKAATGLIESGGDVKLASKTIRGQVERLAHLARSLLSFGRPDALKLVEVSVDGLVREVIDGLRVLPEFDEVRLQIELPTELRLKTDPLLLVSALDNVLRNALEAAVAAKDVGKITEPTVRVAVERPELGLVQIIVEDNAGGPPEGFEARVGEPFFTTKPRGVGLGLTLSRRAIDQLRGVLKFERIAAGSRFTLTLPP